MRIPTAAFGPTIPRAASSALVEISSPAIARVITEINMHSRLARRQEGCGHAPTALSAGCRGVPRDWAHTTPRLWCNTACSSARYCTNRAGLGLGSGNEDEPRNGPRRRLRRARENPNALPAAGAQTNTAAAVQYRAFERGVLHQTRRGGGGVAGWDGWGACGRGSGWRAIHRAERGRGLGQNLGRSPAIARASARVRVHRVQPKEIRRRAATTAPGDGNLKRRGYARGTKVYFVVRYSSMPSNEPSRPMPDCLTPPKGAAAFEMTPALRPIMPVCSFSIMRMPRARSWV